MSGLIQVAESFPFFFFYIHIYIYIYIYIYKTTRFFSGRKEMLSLLLK
jgi:hypothetical protein